MLQAEQNLHKKLTDRKSKGALRSLSIGHSGIDFYSNDYLGLARVKHQFNSSHGATGSRLISGNSAKAEDLESYLATFHKGEAALLYNSGYDANIGLLSCIAGRTDTFLIDELCHASIYDGVRLSYAKTFKFKHNDLEDFRLKLKKASGNVFVVVESVYSMDGDFSPLKELSSICKEQGASLIVDEAHATGVFGEFGEGRAVELGVQHDCFARLHTFGKALGCHGAVVVGSNILKSYLINFSRSFIYTTGMPESALDVIKANYDFLLDSSSRGRVLDLISYFKGKFVDMGFALSDSCIQNILIPGNDNVKRISKAVNEAGVNVKEILHPTVPEGKERIRICLHSFNTKQEVDLLFEVIKKEL